MEAFFGLHTFLHAALLVAAVSADTLAVGFSYGASRIKVPFGSLLVIACVCTLVTGGAVFLGALTMPVLASAAGVVSFCLLCTVACVRLCDSTVKQLIRCHPSLSRRLQFRIFDLRVILHICADSAAADSDHSKTISAKEAVALALALSLDGAAAGIGGGVGAVSVCHTVFLSFLFTLAAFSLGNLIGKRVGTALHFECGFISGALLLTLACLRVFLKL